MNKGQLAVIGGIVGITALVVATANPIPGDEIGVAVLLAIGGLIILGSGSGHFEVGDMVSLDT